MLAGSSPAWVFILKEHGLSDEQITSVMTEHGKTVSDLIIVGRKSPYFSEGLDSPSLRQ